MTWGVVGRDSTKIKHFAKKGILSYPKYHPTNLNADILPILCTITFDKAFRYTIRGHLS